MIVSSDGVGVSPSPDGNGDRWMDCRFLLPDRSDPPSLNPVHCLCLFVVDTLELVEGLIEFLVGRCTRSLHFRMDEWKRVWISRVSRCSWG